MAANTEHMLKKLISLHTATCADFLTYIFFSLIVNQNKEPVSRVDCSSDLWLLCSWSLWLQRCWRCKPWRWFTSCSCPVSRDEITAVGLSVIPNDPASPCCRRLPSSWCDSRDSVFPAGWVFKLFPESRNLLAWRSKVELERNSLPRTKRDQTPATHFFYSYN